MIQDLNHLANASRSLPRVLGWWAVDVSPHLKAPRSLEIDICSLQAKGLESMSPRPRNARGETVARARKLQIDLQTEGLQKGVPSGS